MRIAVVIGHSAAAPGDAVKTGETPRELSQAVTDRLQILAPGSGVDVTVIDRVPGSPEQEARLVHLEASYFCADAILELRFAPGPEVAGLHFGRSPAELLWADLASDAIAEAMNADAAPVAQAVADGDYLPGGPAPSAVVTAIRPQGPLDGVAREAAKAVIASALAFERMQPRSDLAESRTIRAAERSRWAVVAGVWAQITATVGMVASFLLSGVATAQEAATAAVWWAQWLPAAAIPWGAGLAAAIALVSWVVVRIQMTRIEDARLDDHARGLR